MTSQSAESTKAPLTELFLTFFKIGLFTFGGGWAMISIIEREIVDKHHWIERADFLDLLAVAQSLPGILAVNIATSVGDKTRGMRGSVVAALGTILPSFLIILAIAIFLTPDMIKENNTISSIFRGIRPAVVALIIAPVITSARAAKLTWKSAWIPVLVAAMIFFDMGILSNPVFYIFLGGLGGWLVWSLNEKRNSQSISSNQSSKNQNNKES
ncbi:MAG: chromate transporter [Bacteroides sp.]|nr:chromate transporter [Bacteroides sp.]